MAITVVTLRLKVEPWQADIINKRLELCRQIYNNMLHEKLRQWNQMSHLPEYVESKRIIATTMKSDDKNVRRSDEYKRAVKTLDDLYRMYHFSEYGLHKDYPKYQSVYHKNISTTVCQRSITRPLWSALKKKLSDPTITMHFKRYGDFNAVTSDGGSGLRLVDENGKTYLGEEKKNQLFLSFSARDGKELKLHIKMPTDPHKQALLLQRIKEVKLCRTTYKAHYAYVVRITVDGPAIPIINNRTGEVKHLIQTGPVGIYIDTETVTICDATHTEQFSIKDISTKSPLCYEEERAALMQTMDRSRRMNNPENYLPDGTVKKGIINPQSMQKMKLKWTDSKSYQTSKMLLKDNYRKAAETRKIHHGWLANYILSLGDTICINDYPFQLVAQRKEFEKGEEKYLDGPTKKKKQKGHIIYLYAPSMLVTLLDRKLALLGKPQLQKIKLENIDYTLVEYRAYYAKQLFEFASGRTE